MSSVIIKGDTSGQVELASPAVAGSSVQTLVAATGTLAPLIAGTAQTASGSSVDFTGIPSWVKRITVSISGLSFAAAGAGVVRIGSGSLETSGYTSNTMNFTTTPGISTTSQTNGFGTFATNGNSTTINGMFVLVNVNSNLWLMNQQTFRATDGIGVIGSGFISLGGSLDLLSVVATTSTFDAGTINILYE
jgi:hypothetical protein